MGSYPSLKFVGEGWVADTTVGEVAEFCAHKRGGVREGVSPKYALQGEEEGHPTISTSSLNSMSLMTGLKIGKQN